jgi:hypothetical protein
MITCLETGRLAALAMLVGCGILLQFLVSIKIQQQLFIGFTVA